MKLFIIYGVLFVLLNVEWSSEYFNFISDPLGGKRKGDSRMVTDVNRNYIDNFILCQCRNVSVLTSILKGELLFLCLLNYVFNFAQGDNS